jgi:hypothetical protein
MTDIDDDLMIANAEIKRLQAQLAELREDCDITDAANTALHGALQEAERERDAAIADMKLIVDAVKEEYGDETCCFACKYDFDTSCDECGCCPGECPGFESNDCFEWRGPQAEEGDRDE